MQKTITQLWRGNLHPALHSGKNDPEIKHLEDLIQNNLEKLERSLDENEKEILEKYDDCVSEYIFKLCEQAFCTGFSLGARFTAEALYGAEETTEDAP